MEKAAIEMYKKAKNEVINDIRLYFQTRIRQCKINAVERVD